MPAISVVIPTHNRPQFLAKAPASVQAQTFTVYEIIVISNGETTGNHDLSAGAAKRYGARFLDLKDGNLPAARNYGVANAHGEWIAFLDDDDTWMPEKLALQMVAATQSGADMVACAYIQDWGTHATLQQRRFSGLGRVWDINRLIWTMPPSCVLIKLLSCRKSAALIPACAAMKTTICGGESRGTTQSLTFRPQW